jgi:hypothetical protein
MRRDTGLRLTALTALGTLLSGAGRFGRARRRPSEERRVLLTSLVAMGDALQEVSPAGLAQRGGWDRALFDDVLAEIERQTPSFQAALEAYLTAEGAHGAHAVTALLAVDRLSAAYTYWTRLFPPRREQDALFVLSLLHDLSDTVEHAIGVLGEENERTLDRASKR